MKKNTILIIDDEPLFQNTMQILVEKEGFATEICSDGMQAMIRTNQNMQDIAAVLLDIYMPEIDGISLLGHFRSKYPELPIYIISGSEEPEDKTGTLALGAKGYIAKPLDAKAIELLSQILRGLK